MSKSSGNEVSEFLDILSIYLALKNIELNEQQLNDLDRHLQKQDDELLKKIIEQNDIIIRQNNALAEILKELKR